MTGFIAFLPQKNKMEISLLHTAQVYLHFDVFF